MIVIFNIYKYLKKSKQVMSAKNLTSFTSFDLILDDDELMSLPPPDRVRRQTHKSCSICNQRPLQNYGDWSCGVCSPNEVTPKNDVLVVSDQIKEVGNQS